MVQATDIFRERCGNDAFIEFVERNGLEDETEWLTAQIEREG